MIAIYIYQVKQKTFLSKGDVVQHSMFISQIVQQWYSADQFQIEKNYQFEIEIVIV